MTRASTGCAVRGGIGAWLLWGLGGIVVVACPPALAQVEGLPGVLKTAAGKTDDSGKTDTKKADVPREEVATPIAPIAVKNPVSDQAVRTTLQALLPKYPGVRQVQVEVDKGVVTLSGQVKTDSVHDQVTEFVRRVEGVRLVLNRMQTDAQLLGASELAWQVVSGYASVLERRWLLFLIALAVLLGFLGLSSLFRRHSETLLAPFVKNLLLRSVIGSLAATVLIVLGVVLALSVLDLTRIVLSIVGLAGVVGLAVGFAFRDIAENFIASILLGVRRPFGVGDYVKVAGQAGVVQSLNTRATVLVTLEGNHVRIPNAIIFKEILVNASVLPKTRMNFDVLIPYEASTAAAMEAGTAALRGLEGVLPDPPARVLVEGLEPGGVRLRSYFWAPSQGIDGFKLNSDAKLRVKVALQQAGITPAPTNVVMMARSGPAASGGDGSVPARGTARAEANLARDAHAASGANGPSDGRQPPPEEHVLQEAQACALDEGTNLLNDAREGTATRNG